MRGSWGVIGSLRWGIKKVLREIRGRGRDVEKGRKEFLKEKEEVVKGGEEKRGVERGKMSRGRGNGRKGERGGRLML